jgi:DNA-binding response OmpR family regulator
MNAATGKKIAIVIESSHAVAIIIETVLRESNYQVVLTPSHRSAMMEAKAFPIIHLLAACAPSAEEEQRGAYLAQARAAQRKTMAVVMMLGENAREPVDTPEFAQRLSKPFGRDQFIEALCLAEWKVLEL